MRKIAQLRAGLDSASAFTITRSLRNWAHATDATIVVALLQPEPPVYDLVDDVMLVANGRIAFHGARPDVMAHFGRLGFRCPERKATADFLQVRVCLTRRLSQVTDDSYLRFPCRVVDVRLTAVR